MTDNSQMVQPDTIKNLITLGVMLGSLIVGHLVLFLISKYVKKDHDQPLIRSTREAIKTLETINTSDSDTERKPSSQSTQTGVGGGGGRQAV